MRRKSRSAFSLLGLLASVACHTAPPPSSAAWRAPKHAKPPNPDAVTSSSDSSETGSEHPDAGELAIVEVETLRHAFGGQPLGVTVNDVHVGVTPLVVRLPAGSYTLVGAAPKGSHDVGIMLTPGARRRVVFSEGGVQVMTMPPPVLRSASVSGARTNPP